MHPFRTHTCNQLKQEHIGQTVKLSGWIHNRRDHGGVLFIDLRDHYGLTQVVIRPDQPFQYQVAHLSKETVICFTGTVIARSQENINPKMATGEIEVEANAYEVLGECKTLPFTVFQQEEAPEELRLTHRYVDLRRQKMHRNIVLRSEIIARMREYMTGIGFNEMQTPILTSSSPEGARDFLVPSRLHPGHFYALPQAPQQFKQLLMVSGFDKYFQIAPCFRDEDARADRSPGEFYQLDMEMSFATQDDIFGVIEGLFDELFTAFSDASIDKPPYRRIPYAEAMLKYGSDKPDLRIPIEMCDVSDLFEKSGFKAFASVVKNGGVVRAIPVKNMAGTPRRVFDNLVSYAQSIGAKGLAYLVWNEDQVKGPIAKFLTDEQMAELAKTCDVSTSDAVFFMADQPAVAARIAGEIRVKIAQELDLIEKNAFRFCWIVDYPMYEEDETTGQVIFSHNPFSMPQGGMDALLEKDPLTVLAYQYDIVCNGVELSSGAIRNHKPEIMYKAFEIAGYGPEVVDAKFGGMINAFKHGAPPHGGIAPGVDRIVMLLAGTENIREVIAFPMNQRAEDLMMKAPSQVSEDQLKELHLRIVPTKLEE